MCKEWTSCVNRSKMHPGTRESNLEKENLAEVMQIVVYTVLSKDSQVSVFKKKTGNHGLVVGIVGGSFCREPRMCVAGDGLVASSCTWPATCRRQVADARG